MMGPVKTLNLENWLLIKSSILGSTFNNRVSLLKKWFEDIKVLELLKCARHSSHDARYLLSNFVLSGKRFWIKDFAKNWWKKIRVRDEGCVFFKQAFLDTSPEPMLDLTDSYNQETQEILFYWYRLPFGGIRIVRVFQARKYMTKFDFANSLGLTYRTEKKHLIPVSFSAH